MEREITKDLVKQLRVDINKALEAVGKQYGMDLFCGNASFDESTIEFKLGVAYARTEEYDPAKALWDQNCRHIGMEPEDFGKKFIWNGEMYTITGYNRKARVNSVLITDSHGKEYCTSPSIIRAEMGKIPTLTKTDPSTAPAVNDVARERWKRAILFTGLLEEDLGKHLTINGCEWQIVDYEPNAKKYKVVLRKKSTGKDYRFPVADVLSALGRTRIV